MCIINIVNWLQLHNNYFLFHKPASTLPLAPLAGAREAQSSPIESAFSDLQPHSLFSSPLLHQTSRTAQSLTLLVSQPSSDTAMGNQQGGMGGLPPGMGGQGGQQGGQQPKKPGEGEVRSEATTMERGEERRE